MPRSPFEEEKLQEGLARLRELGYLRSPVESFVAKRVSRGKNPWRAALLAGLWLGAGGGALTGCLLTLSVAVAQTEILDNLHDLFWLGLDLVLAAAVLGGVLVTLFAYPLLLSARRNGFSAGQRGELVVFLGSSLLFGLYLSDVMGRFLLVSVQGSTWLLLSLLASLLCALLGVAWGRLLRALLAVARLDQLAVSSAKTAARYTPRVILLGFIATSCLLILGPYRELRPLRGLDAIDPGPPVQTHQPLVLLTVDGAEPSQLPRLRDRLHGELKELRPPGLALHPESFWNCVATGFPPEIHGLVRASSTGPKGVASDLRRARRQPLLELVLRGLLPGIGLAKERAHDQRELLRPQFWEIAAHMGLKMQVVNAWATYPAARHADLTVVSDRCFLRLWEGGTDAAEDPLLVQPPRPDLLPDLREALATRDSYPSLVRGDSLLETLPLHDLQQVADAWHYAVASDLFHASLALKGMDAAGQGGWICHLGGADIVERAAQRIPAGASRTVATRLEALYTNFLDELVLKVVEEVPERARLCLVLSRVGKGERRAWAFPATLAKGEGSVLELTPSLLSILGLPPARDMAGKNKRGPATWGSRPAWTPHAERSSADLQRLRSLGYIGGS